MTTHDLYLLSPELSMVGLATVLLLLDLVMARKSLILGLGVVGLIVPLGFTVALWFTVGDDAAAENTGVLAGTLVVDKFALFFKFLFIGAAAVVGLISIDYVQRFERFRTEFFALALYSATGMMLMAATVELITLYISLGALFAPARGACRVPPGRALVGRRDEVPRAGRDQLGDTPLRHGLRVRLHWHDVSRRDSGASRRPERQLRPAFRQLRSVARNRPDDRRIRLQDYGGAVPDVGAGCL